MRALSYEMPAVRSSAPKPVIVEQPDPVPKQGEVLVRVHYAGMSNFELETARGERNRSLGKRMKKMSVVSGIEMSGTVVGDGQVFSDGDAVVGYTHIFKGPFFHAEFVCVSEQRLAKLPDGISLQMAASLVGGALTSIEALERVANVESEQRILITGASGSVGIAAVQLAAHLGMLIEGVCHSSQTDFVSQSGAVNTWAYDRNEMPPVQQQFDVVFDTAPSLSFAKAQPYLTARGVYINTMPHLDVPGFLRSLFSRRRFGYLMVADTDSQRMTRLADLMCAGAFSDVTYANFPLADAASAFALQLQPGKRGKILLDCLQAQAQV